MRSMGWVTVGSAGVIWLQLLVVACGPSKKDPVSNAGGADNDEAGQGSSDAGTTSGSAGKASTSGGSTHGGGSSGGSGNVGDLDAFLAGEGEGFCARLFRCVEGNDDFSSMRILLKNEQGCKDLLQRVNANSRALRDLRVQIEAGNIHYDPQDGQKCLDDLSACNGANSFSDGPCREAFDGNAKTGEACVRSEDCAGDAYCDSLLQACGGQCAPRKAEGEPCQSDNDCAYTAGVVFCDNSTANAVCHTLVPALKASEGEPCTRKLEGALALTPCQEGLWCATAPGGDPDADVLGQCAPPIATNAPCFDGDDFCSEGVCDTNAGICQAITLITTVGAACNDISWSICDPTLGFHCNAAGTCDASGDGHEGSACFGSDLQRGCDAGLHCAKPDQSTSNDPGTCRAFLAEGAACSKGQDCGSGNCVAGVCGGRPCLD